MSRLHIMTGNGNTFTVICHAPTPSGNNSANVPWSTALKTGLSPKTRMNIGSGAGQISTAEANDVSNGIVIEVSFQFTDDPSWDTATRNAQLNLVAADAVTRTQNDLAARLKWFGAEVT